MASIPEIFETMAYGPAPEADGPALKWLESHGRTFRLLHQREVGPPRSGEHFETVNPATARAAGPESPRRMRADVDAAVAAARKALPGWQALGGHGRARYLYALARQVQKHSRLFAVLESLDNGKPIRESRDIDIPLVARHFYYHAGWAHLMEREFPGYEPVGVIGQIIPWNFPLLMLSWKIAPALAMGNTVVLKPAEFTSLTALLFADICHEAGLPPGVVNIVTGDGRDGRGAGHASRASTRSPSPARPRSAGSSGPARPAAGRRCRSSWAGSLLSSCSTMPTSTAWWKAWWMRSGSTRARSAVPDRGSWRRRASPPG